MRRHPQRDANPDHLFDYVGDKNLKKVQKRAWEAGWWPKRTKKGIMWQAPDEVGQVLLHGSASASDHHAYAKRMSRSPWKFLVAIR